MAPDPPRVRGVLFDLWNTLVFSGVEPGPMEMLASALGILGRSGWKKEIERGMMTAPFLGIREALVALERRSGRAIAPPGSREAFIRAWNRASAATTLYDDALPCLRALRLRFRLGILSNTQSFDTEFIRTRGLGQAVDALCLSWEIGALKPDPSVFHGAAARLGLPPAEVLMVGDSAVDDVTGALRAGLQAVHLVRTGGADHVPGSRGAIASLTGLASLLS